VQGSGIATVVDSLAAINQIVFTDQEMSLTGLGFFAQESGLHQGIKQAGDSAFMQPKHFASWLLVRAGFSSEKHSSSFAARSTELIRYGLDAIALPLIDGGWIHSRQIYSISTVYGRQSNIRFTIVSYMQLCFIFSK
jgi:hypothetical protein